MPSLHRLLLGLLWFGGYAFASPTCDAAQMQLDVILMIDNSEIIAEEDFRKLTTFVGNLFAALNISPSGTRVAICGNFGNNNPIAYINLKQSSDIGHLRSVLTSLPRAGGTSYGITLNSFWSWGISTFGNRAEAADVMVVFSASPLGGYDPVYPLKDFRAGGGRVVTVALGGLAAVELAPLASADRYATAVADYDHLHGHTDFLLNSMCDARCWSHVETELSAPSAAFHSALYPNDYCNNFISYHRMISPEPMRLHMRIPQFSLANGDYANVHGGLNTEEIKDKYRGVKHIDFHSSWNEMEFQLHTGQFGTEKGFSGAYTSCIPGLFAVCAPFETGNRSSTRTEALNTQVIPKRPTAVQSRRADKIPASSNLTARMPENVKPIAAETAGSYCNPKNNSWDVVLMLDSMGDMPRIEFNQIIDFLRFTFFPEFFISLGDVATRVGIMIPFAGLHERLGYLTLAESTDLAAVQNALRNVPYLGSDHYEMDEEAVLAYGMFTPPSHNRPNVTDVIMIFTAVGRRGYDTGYGFGDFEDQGGRVIAVGVGANVDAEDLAAVATGPHAFHVDRAAELANINVDLLNALCDDLCYPAANALLTAPTGTLSTPAYPNAYCNNLDANYLISLPTPLTADARIPRLQSEECCDFLHVFGGANLAQPGGSYSGDKRDIRYRSSNGNAYFRFTTDSTETESGFEANYKACIPGLFAVCATD